MRWKRNGLVPLNIYVDKKDSRVCGDDCNFILYDEVWCSLFMRSLEYTDEEKLSYFRRCRKCIKEFGK